MSLRSRPGKDLWYSEQALLGSGYGILIRWSLVISDESLFEVRPGVNIGF